MDTVKVLVGSGGKAGITCPHCGKHHLAAVDKFRGVKNLLSLKCSCGERFKVELNFRKHARKKVRLTGTFRNLTSGSSKRRSMTVNDLSLNGLAFTTIGSTDIETGHRLLVHFTLDNRKGTELERTVSVMNVRDTTYGCRFVNAEFEKELGFYLGT